LDVDGKNQKLAFLERGMLYDESRQYRSFHNQAQIVGRNFNPYCSYIASDAHRCYEPYLNKFERHVLFVRPDYFVILDRINTLNVSGETHNAFNINNIDGKTQFDMCQNRLVAKRPHANVSFTYAFPGTITFDQKDSKLHTAYHIFPDQKVEGTWGSAIRFIPKVDDSFPGHIDYFYVICPEKKRDESPIVKLTSVETDKDNQYVLKSCTMEVKFRNRKSIFRIDGEDIFFTGSEGEHYQF